MWGHRNDWPASFRFAYAFRQPQAEFASGGTAELTGVVKPSGSYKAAIRYRFQSDPGHLTTVKELKLLTEKFPAKQKS